VIPGDTLVFELELMSPIRRGLVNMKGKAYVNGEIVSEAEMLAQVVKEKNK
jgi:UDP-3-O-[3-hydroxymyristoyl] N-acetylglucosamine deacetylase/3-hydroxyacyl-[acyl-carrier-protein] dehydratase